MNLAPFRNPFAKPPGCATCDDTRMVSAHDYSARPCPVCGCSCPKREKGEPPPDPCAGCRKSRDLKHAAALRFYARPTIAEGSLSARERELVADWRARFPPKTPTSVFLSWIEGQRYDPAKDPEFLVECERELNNWRRYTGRPEQPLGSLVASLKRPEPAGSPQNGAQARSLPRPATIDPGAAVLGRAETVGLPGGEKGERESQNGTTFLPPSEVSENPAGETEKPGPGCRKIRQGAPVDVATPGGEGDDLPEAGGTAALAPGSFSTSGEPPGPRSRGSDEAGVSEPPPAPGSLEDDDAPPF